ncbi:MAG: hypothetical protein K0S01_3976 [Herbinix sp.]|jgi:hypothetical protein|nr:hypothetical protein [Herbinix sp.]
MLKAKLCGFAIACMVGIMGTSPITSFAAETNIESEKQSETNKDHKEKKAAFEEKMKAANDKWSTLTVDQKAAIYALIENEMQAENKLMDKLVEYGVMEKADAVIMKAHMAERFNKVKKSGEFPLLRQKCNKSRK